MKKTWEMIAPPEPDARIFKVSDRDGDEWLRDADNTWAHVGIGTGTAWADLVKTYGPIYAELPDPIVLTNAALAAGWGELYDRDTVRRNVVAALRAAGYEVAE